jgi:DNA-binding MarR family transcriptional regulator
MPLLQDPDSFGFLVTDVSRLLRAEFDRRITEAGLGLTPGEARTLTHANRIGMVRQTVLAESMGVEAMTLSTYLDRLEGRGLIERKPDTEDRRAKLVKLTDRAYHVLETVQEIGAGLRADIAAKISAPEWQQLNQALVHARDSLNQLRTEAVRRESNVA